MRSNKLRRKANITFHREVDNVSSKVEKLLDEIPDTRNNDLYLQWIYLLRFEEIEMPYIPYSKFKELSSIMETIRRCRQKLQNTEKKYPPTDLEVAMKRGWAEEDWRKYFGHSNA